MKAKVKIDEVFKITGRGVVASCKILEGKISCGDSIVLGENEHTIIGVEGFSGNFGNKPNYNVGLILKSIDDIDEFKKEVLKYKDTEAVIK